MTELRFEITVRTMESLPRLLMLTARLGGQIGLLLAESEHVLLEVAAPDETAHRLGPQLGRLMDVVEIRTLEKDEAVASFDTERLRHVYTV
jgi:hypothetical protein